MTYPVTVVIPTIDSRYEFLTKRCLPSVKAAGPAQIVVVFGDRNGNRKRNEGARAATQPFLLFVDDDSEVRSDCLQKMIYAFDRDPDAAFAYSNYCVSVQPGIDYVNPSGNMYPGTWNVDRLRKGNYIDVTSLIRMDRFFGFDPDLERFQDWDLWLTLIADRRHGTYVQENLFMKCVIDQGITARIPEREAKEIVMRKHGLL